MSTLESTHHIKWLNALIVVLTVIGCTFLAQMLWQLCGQFSDIILLFVLAVLVAFVLNPLIGRIDSKPLASGIVLFARRHFGPKFSSDVERFRFTRLFAVVVVYLTLALLLVVAVVVLIRPSAQQLNQLSGAYPDFVNRFSVALPTLQQWLAAMGVRTSDIGNALSAIQGSLQNVAALALQNTLVFLAGVATLLSNLLLVLFLSFFFALDGPRLFRQGFELVPQKYDVVLRVFVAALDKSFGGYIRLNLLQAFLIGAGTMLCMALFGEPFVLVAGLLAAFFMLVPFVGPALALFPPVLAALSHDPTQAAAVFIILLVYQLLVVNVLMPKLTSQALGLHPLLIIASLLLGVKVAGVWGALFGVPVVGVIQTMVLFFHQRRVNNHGLEDDQREPAQQSPSPLPSPGRQESAPASTALKPGKS